ncbi:hypothetical protein C2E25_06470 [Geothermobacter hydrogeniphilus]|uniref:PAS domain-containing protein n=1 Tax=Geothermobacter hydrogeniphilus TaxID=1969733 RepID=A0A2K2HBP6_9BACT|nr:PAS domain-containing protein [Geothermobacter hydrogeniphilus]PNU20681.1 hypothetical protein C2E25_06470 [Geothermobacter hydrogeniphilus]
MPLQIDFYKMMVDHLAEGVYFVDQQRRILYWNPAAERLTGFKADQILGYCCNSGGGGGKSF